MSGAEMAKQMVLGLAMAMAVAMGKGIGRLGKGMRQWGKWPGQMARASGWGK